MRVLTGRAKGVALKAPRASGVRPTSSLVKNAIFSVLGPGGLDGARVLDLYAGTGALGIEALSRGAASVDFVERNARMCGVIRSNVASAGFAGRARVFRAPVQRALKLLEGPYDLVLMDPPYEDDVGGLMPRLERAGLLRQGAVIVLEHAWRSGAPACRGKLTLEKTRRYGDTAVTFYRMERAA